MSLNSMKEKLEKLKPEEKLKIKQLKFRLSDLRPIRPSKHYMIRFVNIEARVLGKIENEISNKK